MRAEQIGDYQGQQHNVTSQEELELWVRIGDIMDKANKTLTSNGDEDLWTDVATPILNLTMDQKDSLFEVMPVYVRVSPFPLYLLPVFSFLSLWEVFLSSFSNITNLDIA